MSTSKHPQLPASLSALIDPSRPYDKAIGGRSANTTQVHLRVRGRAYLKSVPKELSSHLEGEARALKWLNGRIHVPKLLGSGVDSEGRAYLLMSEISGKDLSAWAKTHPEEVVNRCAIALRELHQLPHVDCPLDQRLTVKLARARENARRNRVDLNDLDAVRQGWSLEALLLELECTKPVTEDLVFTHGDAWLPNWMLPALLFINC